MSENIEVVVKNATNSSGGPFWDATAKCVYYADSYADVVHKYDLVTGEDSRLSLGNSILTIFIPRQKGGFVATQKTELVTVDSWDSGKVSTFAKMEVDSNRLSDGRADATGRLWLSSTFKRTGGNPATSARDGLKDYRVAGSLYSVEVDGTVRTHLSDLALPSGLDWSSDNRTMYLAETVSAQIWAYDFDLESGTICNKRTVFDFGSSEASAGGYPDGMTIDAEDKLWVACLDTGKLLRVDPHTGTVMHSTQFPVKHVSHCCFAGENLDELYVTTMHVLMTSEEEERFPLAGSLFKVTGLGVKGRKKHIFAG